MKRKLVQAGAALAAGLLALSLCACSGEKEAASGEKNASGESSAAAVTGSPAGKEKETAAEKAKDVEKETETKEETTEAEEEWPEIFVSPLNQSVKNYATASNGWIYYRAGNSDVGYIYRMRPDGSDAQMIYGGDRPFYITVEGDWVYCAPNDAQICKMKTDGTGYTCLLDGAGGPILVHDGWVYFKDDEYAEELNGFQSWLMRMKTDGSEVSKVVSGGSGGYCIADDLLYYAHYVKDENVYEIFQAQLDGSNPRSMGKTVENYDTWWVDGGYIYISNYNSCWNCRRKIEISTLEVTDYEYDESNEKLVTDGWIYFKVGEEGLYPVWPDYYSTDMDVFHHGRGHCMLSVVGDWGFYLDPDQGNQMYRIPVGSTDAGDAVKLE